MTQYYIAYGSNLNLQQMSIRCPDSKLVATGIMENYQLVFKGTNRHSGVATLEKCPGKQTPIGVFKISKRDELALDRYEGYPHLYDKSYRKIRIGNIKTTAMLYLLDGPYQYCLPSKSYYQTIKQGYQDCRLDVRILDEAITEMKTTIQEQEIKEQYPYGYRDIRQ